MGSPSTPTAVIDLVGRGWPVLPLYEPTPDGCSCGKPCCTNIGKHPRTVNGLKDATAEEARALEWWRLWPAANVGLVTGPVSRIVAIDVDAGKGGYESLEALEREFGDLPRTVRSRTGGGGRHYLFAYPEAGARNCTGLLPGIDVRGEGGYIVVPPSVHGNGNRYEWDESGSPDRAAVAQLPAWLLRLIQGRRLIKAALAGGTEPILQGMRNDGLTRTAGTLRCRGYELDDIRLGLQIANALRCKPPLGSDEVESIAASVAKYPVPDAAGKLPSASREEPRRLRRSVPRATAVLRLAQEIVTAAYVAPDGSPYVRTEQDGVIDTVRMDSAQFADGLRRLYSVRTGDTISRQVLQTALEHLGAEVRYTGAVRPEFVRVGEAGGVTYLDLANRERQVIEITAAGWRVTSDPPVLFHRGLGMLPLPVPAEDGSIDWLRPFLNVSDDPWILIAAFLIGAYRPGIAYPLLVLNGGKGSAKSTTARMIRDLIDPNVAPLRTQPANVLDLMVAARHSLVQAYDNISAIPPWLSDAFCRLSTGGGYSTRKYYTNGEEFIFSATRPFVLNGITEFVERPDLMDRCILLTLDPIPERERRCEQELFQSFQSARPHILGGLLNCLVCAIRNRADPPRADLPRLADFASYVAAAEGALPWEPGAFMRVYRDNRRETHMDMVEKSPVGCQLMQFVREQKKWQGTATELLDALKLYGKRSDLPRNGRSLSSLLRRLADDLRAVGVEIDFDRKHGGRLILAALREGL